MLTAPAEHATTTAPTPQASPLEQIPAEPLAALGESVGPLVPEVADWPESPPDRDRRTPTLRSIALFDDGYAGPDYFLMGRDR